MAEREEVPTRSWLGRVRLIILVLCVAFCGTATCGWAYDYYVTSTADSGGGEGVFGTFRNAMFYQSTDNDPWWINFEIPTTDPGYDPATGTWTIHLTGQPLYPVDSPSPTEIRGSSQPDYDGINPSGPRIIIDGSGMNSDTDVLVITSDGNDVEGICILNGQRDGIVLHDTAWTDCSSNWIHGCFLGVCPVAGGPDIWSSILFSTAIVIAEGAHDNTIEENLVTASGGNGIMVSGENTDRNMLTRNKFRPNAALAIALIPGGENDGAMNPEYANDGMDHPVITQAILYQGGVYEWSLTVTGYIGVSPCGDAFFGDTVEFFLASPDGEGELYLGECDVGMATGKENAFISTLDVSTVGLTLSDSIIATAIHGDGNTSEFSSPVQVTDAHTVLVMATTDVLDGNAASISALTSNPGLDGLVSLREAITACNNTPGADTIRFNVPECDPGYSASAGTWTIELTSPLPGLDDNDGVFVDGSSQTANQGDRNAFGPEIVISGASLPASPPGAGPILEIQSSYNHVRQLVLGGNPSVAANVGGIVFWGSESHDNWIEGCYIGVDPTGRAAMPNGGAGIFFDDMGHNIIGTDGDGTEDALEGNVIAANETGGIFSMSVLRNPEYNVIAGNRIGVGTDGTPLPNGVAGIFLGTGDGNRIGSNNDGVSDALEANVIERNDGPGIAVGTKLNTLSRNAFYGNDQLGIDLGTTVGVDVNDGLLNPGSANNGMDYPVFTAASLEGNTLHVEGYIGTNPSGTTTFASSRVEVYLSSYDGSTDPNPGTADAPPYHGEGKVYLGALTANGSSLFAGDLNVTGKGLTEADFLTATATNTAGNTSEFSGNFSLLPPWPPGAAVVDTTSDVADGNTSSISALALNRGADGFVSLREAITACNNTAGANTIVFNVPLSDPGHAGGVWTIQPTSALPALTDDTGVFIDGSSQATFIGGDPNPSGPEIAIDGFSLSAWGILTIRSSNNRIRRLVLSGGAGGCAGLYFDGANAHDNWVEGCYIGVDHTGTAAMGNGTGILLDSADSNTFGTNGDGANDALEGNVITSNRNCAMIVFGLGGSDNNVIAGNRIGVGTNGTPLPNAVSGIDLGTGIGNRIGSDNDGTSDDLEANIIACNVGPGIDIVQGANRLSRNAFYDNSWLGIDLAPWGVNANNGAMNPAQGNNGMDYPVLTAASLEGSTLHVEGYIGTNPSGTTTFASSRVEVYLSSYDGSTDPNPGTADAPPYHGEGKVYLGALTANGSSLFAGDLNVTGKGLTEADFLTATATNTAGNTSEFSGNFSLLPPWPPGAAVVDTTSDVADGNTSSISALALNRGADGFVSLREAITACNNTAGANTIVFNVPLSDPGHAGGVWTIQPTSALPALTDDDGVFIDGSSQATFIGGDPNPDGPEILIRPGMFFGYGPLLQITSSNNHVRRLVIGGARNDPGGWGMIGHGIRLWGSNAHDNWIEGCYIGVDATGSGLLANDNDGVHLHQAGNNIIGTNGDGSNDDVEGNVIGGNGTRGICIDGTDQTNVIAGNRIGIGTDGTPLPNGEGVVIVEAFNCQIGSDNDSVSDDLEANIIACNTWRAVFVFLDGHPSSNLLSRNSIYGHARLGIEFEPYGVNENDGVKNTSHVNDGMDFPVFTAASLSGTTLHVKGYIGTNPSGTTTFANSRVEVYLSSYDGSTSPNPSESGDTAPYHGEGKVYLGALTASGQSLFEGDLNVTGKGLLLGDYVTGTATDTAGNTSEFSENREIAPPIDITASKISDPPGGGAQTVSPGDPITYTVEITNNGTSAQANLGTNEFEDTLPADTVYVSGTGEAVLDSTGNPWGTLDIVDDDVTWNGTIPAGDTVEITFAVEVLPTTQTSLCNSDAAVHWDGGTIPLDSGCVPFTAGPYISATKVSDPVGDGSQHVRPGEEITYTVTISNSGTIDQANLVTNEFVDTLPWHTSYVAGTGTAVLDSTGNPWGTLDIVDDDVTWNGTIPADDTVEISFTVAVLPAPAVTLCNPDAEVHWDKGTLTLDSGCIPLTPVPSLRVSKVAADENGVPLDRDDLVTYTITIWNEGYGSQSDNPGHEFEDPIPAHATYEPGTATAKRNDLPWGTIAYTSGRIVWDGAIGIGDFIRIEFKVRIDADTPYGTPICNDQAVVHWDANKDGTNETNLAIEAVCLTVTAEGAPLIEADKVGADDNGPPLIVGDTITYTITLVNSGPGVQPNDPASNELVDPIPEGTTYVANSLSATSGTATYDAVAKQVLWNGEIAPAETIEISFKVTVDECTGECEAISNAADVHWDADGDGTNDTVIVTSPPDFPPPAKAPGRVQIRAAITATDLDGPPLRTRDTLVYRITISNEGTEAQPDDPRGPEFVQAIPEGTTYVSNSARAIRSTSSSATSQSLNAKPAAVSILGIWYDPATATIYWNGSIPAGETIVIEYQVIVAAFVACGAEISCCGSVWWDSDSDGTNDSECPLTVTLTVEEGALGPGGVMARPNPVGSGGVVFTFDLPNDTHTAWFKLFDIDGTLLFSQEILPDVGIFPIVGTWNPQDSLGRPLGNGLYLYTVIIRHTNGTMSQSRVYKLVVAR